MAIKDKKESGNQGKGKTGRLVEPSMYKNN